MFINVVIDVLYKVWLRICEQSWAQENTEGLEVSPTCNPSDIFLRLKKCLKGSTIAQY